MAINTTTVGAGTLTVGAVAELTNFSGQVTSVRVIPSVDYGDQLRALSGEVVAGDRTESWTIEGTILQDLGATESTTEWLFEHRGESHVFEFVPNTAKGKKVVGTVTVEAIEVGGDVGTKPTSDFAWTLVGDPVITDLTV